MIFVTVGTQPAPFDRLLLALEALPREEELVVQCGSSRVRPSRATCFDFLPFDDVVRYLGAARVVIAHAGVGSTIMALASGKRPILVPRLRELGEHPDDHQHEWARRFAHAGLVTLVEDPSELPRAVLAADTASSHELRASARLVAELRDYVVESKRARGRG